MRNRALGAILALALLVGAIVLASLPGGHHPADPATPAVLARPALPPETAITPDGAVPGLRSGIVAVAASLQKHISPAGLHLIESFEGYSRCSYWDQYGGVWTVGFGQTRGAYRGFCFSGLAAAEANLKASVESEYEWALRGLGVSLNQNQWDALASFAYNLGAGIFTGSLRYAIRHHNPYPMLAYDHAGGIVLAGLSRRRHEEVALFLKPTAHVTAAQLYAARLRALHRAQARRRELHADIERHHCRPGDHARPRSYHTLCGRWLREGQAAIRAIHRYHREGVH